MIDQTDILLKNEYIVYSIINKYTCYFDKDDLYQVGMMGLIEALKHYKNDMNTKFSSFAYFYVSGAVKSYIRKSSTMKVSKELVRLNVSIEKAKEVLAQRLGKIPTEDDIALFLEVAPNLVREAKEANTLVQSLDYENEEEIELYDKVGYQEKSYKEELLDLKVALESLSPYERNLIEKRYNEGLTQSELSKELGINQVKVSRQEKEILTRLRTRLR